MLEGSYVFPPASERFDRPPPVRGVVGSKSADIRLCRRLRLVAGRTRLLRLLTASTVSDRAPRVLGVDEFAFHKGFTYGTVLVDVEAGRVVDVPPDRTSETFAAWLKKHPGAEIICRTGLVMSLW
ncbi:transposase [Streptomyces sp. NPDC059402]|uniref:transposase n=1 Tax=Streptomyces sp. NPDC059402 TaxID=3346822 RepID=UPI003679D902